jgi:PAS domain S-box-containing protein
MAADFLEREDERIQVLTETSASDGHDVLADGDVDCIVSDYDMPGTDGLEFLRAVREEQPDAPFILYTGKGSEEIASEAISVGVTDYLQKGNGTDQYALLANRIVNAVEKHTAEKAVQATTRRFETLLEHSADYIHVLGPDGIAEYHSPSVERVLGYAPEELDGTDPFERLHPDDREAARRKFEDCIGEPGREVTAEMRARHKDGSWRWLEVKSRNLLDDPTVGGIVGNVRDITERKETEAAVDWHEAVIRNMGEGVYVFDADYEFQFVDYRAGALDEISEQNWVGRRLSYLADIDILSQSEVERIRDGADRIVAGDSEQVDIRIAPSLPEPSDVVELRLTPLEIDDSEELILATTRDVTEHQRRERELREEKAFRDAALEGLADFYWTVDPDGRVTRWSDADGEVTGYDADDAIGMHSSEFHPDEHVPRIRRAMEGMKGQGATTVEADLLTEDGNRVPYRFTGVSITDDDGEVRSICGLGQDITERTERAQHLERFRMIVNAMDDAAFVVEDDWTVTYANEAALNNVEESAANVENQPILPLVERYTAADEDSRRFARALERAFDTPGSSSPSERVELTLDVDGDRRTFEHRFSPITTGETTESVVVISRDVTARKERERELERKNQRLEEFTDVVSHDLRNPLRVVEGRLELAREQCNSPHLADAASGVERSLSLLDDLLTLAREGEGAGDVRQMDLAEVCDDCWQNVATADASLVTETDRTVRADPSRLKQLFENLFRNSVEHGSTSNRRESAGDAVEHGGADVTVTVGDLVERDGFYVADDGSGIPPDECEHVFEMGHSTAEGSTGFGLNIVQRVVEAHGWTISVTDGEDGGARFEVVSADTRG